MEIKVIQTLGLDVLSGTGSPIRVFEISKNLAKRGIDTSVTSFNYEEGLTLTQKDGIDIWRVPFCNVKTEEGRYFVNVPNLFRINKRTVKERDIDIIHAHLFPAASSAYLVKKQLGVPYIYDMHSLFPDEILSESGMIRSVRYSPWVMLESLIRKSASYIVATSDTMRDYLVRRGYERVESVPVGVDRDYFKPARKDQGIVREYGLEGKKVIMYTGNTNRYQGMDDIIECAPRVLKEDSDAVFVIVGGGHELDVYKKRARRLGISEGVVFTGPKGYSMMPSFLSVADICLSMRTSNFAGNMTFPTKLTTYMAAGKPSVATKVGDQEEIINKGVGYLVESGNSEEAAETILEALSDKAKLKGMGRKARDVAVKEFSWDVLCERYLRIYDILIS